MSVEQEINSLAPEGYIELFEIDTTLIGGTQVLRFVPDTYDSANVVWQGNTYLQFPIEADGFESTGDGSAPPRPKLVVSNVNKIILASVISLGDLVGAKVTRWRTFAKFLDGQPEADPNSHLARDTYFIEQKTAHTPQVFEFTLSSGLDLIGRTLPRRQILRDDTTGNLYAPGVASARFRGR